MMRMLFCKVIAKKQENSFSKYILQISSVQVYSNDNQLPV